MASESRQVSERIERPVSEVYDFVVEPANLPLWAPGLGSSVENIDGRWFVDTPEGRAELAFAERNGFGVLDHYVTMPWGEVFYNPMRVVADGDSCEVLFTVRRRPDLSDEDFDRDAGGVQADLTRLKRLLEAA